MIEFHTYEWEETEEQNAIVPAQETKQATMAEQKTTHHHERECKQLLHKLQHSLDMHMQNAKPIAAQVEATMKSKLKQESKFARILARIHKMQAQWQAKRNKMISSALDALQHLVM